MFEHGSKKPISRSAFIRRMLIWLLLTMCLFSISLLIGVIGYHYFENLSWIDSLLNASMILGGMGEVDPLHTTGGKLFASFYALYSAIFLIICSGLLLVPIFHRVLHVFHADKE